MWAHAEYVKLLRSKADGRVFDLIPEVASRYLTGKPRPAIEVWKSNRRVKSTPAGSTLRIVAPSSFMLHWTVDDWHTATDSQSTNLPQDLSYCDLTIADTQRGTMRFTFFWKEENRWEERDYQVAIQE